MKWKQFFTPVSSIKNDEAKSLIASSLDNDLVLLDVRQPKEYENSHLPGAKLIPLGELGSRFNELDPETPIIVY